MNNPAAELRLRWLLVPASWVLLMSGMSLYQHQLAYTGIALRPDDIIEAVDPASPGALARLQPGDRLIAADPPASTVVLGAGPLSSARPGLPLALERERDGVRAPLWLAPRMPPGSEQRFAVVIFGVAAAFLLLGGWVWSERRDGLTRTFYLLCLSFAVWLAPLPPFANRTAGFVYECITLVAQLFLGPLFSHFFALFPESGRPRAGAWVLTCYALATLLLASFTGVLVESAVGPGRMASLLPLLRVAPSAVFAAGLLGGLVLFALAFARAETPDARRRLRVAFVGTLLGALPLALLVGLRNLWRTPALPGERWAVPFLIFVPLSFAWAMAVHNVFDFRVALRAVTRAFVALLGAGLLYAAGEWLASSYWPALSAGATGAALAICTLAAALAGPARGWLGATGRRLVPIADEWSLAEWSPGAGDEPQLLGEACQAIVRALRVEGCGALRLDEGGALAAHAGMQRAPTLSPAATDALRHLTGPREPLELRLSSDDRDALEHAGVRWLLPVHARLALVIGPRFAGAWLSRSEARALERLAQLLAVGLENIELRQQARGHGALARDLRAAHAVQARRLPRRTPVYPTLDCAAATLATEEIGGDYYDFVETGGREFTLAVGDAAGHGVSAALVLAGVQSRFRDEAQRARHPGELVEAMNRDLVALDQPEHFMALVCACVDAGTGAVRFANAGLTPPLLRRRDGRRTPLTESGVLLGVQPGSEYTVTNIELEPGDVLVVYTDGLTEASRSGELFGDEQVWQVLDCHAHRRAADMLEELMSAVRAWSDGPLDDLTIVVLKQLSRARTSRPAPIRIPG
jgi:serine phosphatase RsbU (regulator of sigma subunit)